MNIKQLLCLMLATAICCAGIFAQNTRSALESLSLDFAERLIRDGGNEAKIAELSQNLSEDDRAYLAEYRDLNALMNKPSKIKKNRALIAQKAESFSAPEREDLYTAHTVKNNTWALNMLPSFGIGSFVQGDTVGGLIQLAACGAGTIFFLSGIFGEKETDGKRESLTASSGYRMIIGLSILSITPTIIGTIRPAYFKSTRNAYLRSSLGLDKNGKAVAQNKDKRDVQISFAPIINPVSQDYGAVAMIRL